MAKRGMLTIPLRPGKDDDIRDWFEQVKPSHVDKTDFTRAALRAMMFGQEERFEITLEPGEVQTKTALADEDLDGNLDSSLGL